MGTTLAMWIRARENHRIGNWGNRDGEWDNACVVESPPAQTQQGLEVSCLEAYSCGNPPEAPRCIPPLTTGTMYLKNVVVQPSKPLSS
jgi:hypothetical protein